MSRYKVQPVQGWPRLREVIRPVQNGDAIICERVSEAEASIIAFALNAVAEGLELASVPEQKNYMGMYEVRAFYDGPTEGVAP